MPGPSSVQRLPVAVVDANPRPDSRRLPRAAQQAAIFLAFLIIYIVFAPRIIRYLDPLTGDEPFYVMTALSIARDGDLNETNNYARRDYESFYPPDPLPPDWKGWPAFPRTLPPHPAHSVQPGLYSKHGLGVVLLILVPYLIGGRAAVVLLLNVCAALVAVNIFLIARRYLPGWRLALGLTAALALSSPLMSYAYLIFPETFAALAIVYVFRRGREPRSAAWQWLLVGCGLALLPWLHARFIPAVLGLTLGLLPALAREARWHRRATFALPLVLSAITIILFYLYIYGQPYPSSADHAGFSGVAGAVNGFFGLFLDEQWGLLVYTPIYLAGLMTAIDYFRGRRSDATALLAAIAPYLLLVAFYRVWWGEWGPPARYVAPVAPLFAAPIAWWFSRITARGAVAALALLATPGLLVKGAFIAAPQLMYNQPDGHSALFAAAADQLGLHWPKVLPSYQFFAQSPVSIRATWSFALICLVIAPPLVAAWRRRATYKPPPAIAGPRSPG